MTRKSNINESDEVIDLCEFVSDRISHLRMKKNVSEYQMSLDLGQNRTYIQNIASKRSLPSLSAFFKICKYLDITPIEFFDIDLKESAEYTEVKEEINKLPLKDVEFIKSVVQYLQLKNDKGDI